MKMKKRSKVLLVIAVILALYVLIILPGTPEENAPVFDFAAESIQPAA